MNRKKTIAQACAAILAVSGLIILFSTIYPLLLYEWEIGRKYPSLITPLIMDYEGKKDVDFTKASTWFTDQEKVTFVSDEVSYYTLSVPKLNIYNASVAIGGEDLSESLIQYPGTAAPGSLGNAVIFGHSILPQYYDPKSYMAIFSILYKLKKGDEVHVNYKGVSYVYEVDTLFEVKPTDLQILEQNTSDSYLSLVTCTPPGHPLKPKRLIVRARIIPQEKHAQAFTGN